MFRFFESLIDPFKRYEDGAPPATLRGFYWHYLRQVWPTFAVLLAIGLVVALIEVSIFRYIGEIVDILGQTTPDRLWADHGGAFLWMAAVILVARPIFQGLHDLMVHQAIAPGFTNLVRWQNHRHVLRQSIGFFNNDFAGRVANKVIQTGPSLRESLVQVADAVWFVALYTASALVLFAEADWRLAAPLVVWIGCYLLILRRFVPRTKQKSEEISEARSLLTGRIVDSYTNIHTVKLFAHAEREDAFARQALEDHTAVFYDQQRLITGMTMTISLLNSVLVTLTGAIAIWLWSAGEITTGAIALVGGLVVRIINMSGWIMWEVTGIFENIGTVQDGISTIARPHDVRDAEGARPLTVTGGEIRFDDVHFHYGKARGALDGVTLTVLPARRSAWSARPARASRRSSTCSCGSTTSKRAASRSTGRTSPWSRRTRCAPRSASSRRTPRCSTAPSGRTSSTVSRTRPTRRCAVPRTSPARATSSPISWMRRGGRATTPTSASAG